MGFSLGTAVNPITDSLNNLYGRLNGGTQTSTQVPLETPEQAAMRKKLAEFANTGTFGNFTAGADAGIGYGDYSVNPYETQGLGILGGLLNSGTPSGFKLGDSALQDLLATSPQQIEQQFQPVKDQVARSIATGNADLKRNAGFAGNLYSTDTVRNLGDIQARGNENLTASIADLTNKALDRRLQAIPLAYQSANDQENLMMNRVEASQTYGGLARSLNNQAVAERNAEILRKRQELQLPIQAAENVAGQNTQYGVPSVQVAKPNPYMDFLNMIVQVGGRVASAKAGAPMMMASGGGGGSSTLPNGYAPYNSGNPLSLYGQYGG